jgi:hypothetical protein
VLFRKGKSHFRYLIINPIKIGIINSIGNPLIFDLLAIKKKSKYANISTGIDHPKPLNEDGERNQPEFTTKRLSIK